ncbi:hypothetical protein CFP56_036456 [Quercus suber]|uniref:Uncharacterized protein n=1 Tax=Quercus suber TaxID=58331 RepID=A0AAW0LPU7_QUESU
MQLALSKSNDIAIPIKYRGSGFKFEHTRGMGFVELRFGSRVQQENHRDEFFSSRDSLTAFKSDGINF